MTLAIANGTGLVWVVGLLLVLSLASTELPAHWFEREKRCYSHGAYVGRVAGRDQCLYSFCE
jgi:hypothetical protein